MKRREFIAGIGSAAGWPMLARSQQDKVWRVGYLNLSSATKRSVALVDIFKTKLEQLGYVEGKNLNLDLRRADDDYTRLPTLAAALVSFSPDVIVSTTSPTTAEKPH